MIRQKLVRAAVALALAGNAIAGHATAVQFSGAMTGLGIGGPGPGCDPLPFRSTIPVDTSAGTSNLGSFTYTHTICLGGIDAPSNGTFQINFADGAIFGTLEGYAYATAIPGIGHPEWNYTILGGTGDFLGASGNFLGDALTDARTRPTHVSIAFSGDIGVPAVPEPTAWSLFILGFAAVGIAIRRSRTTLLPQLA